LVRKQNAKHLLVTPRAVHPARIMVVNGADLFMSRTHETNDLS